MSRIFAYLGNDRERVGCALLAARPLLSEPNPASAESPSVNGWGIGFYQGGEILLQRRPKAPPHPVDFYEAARELHSDAIIGHVRAGTVGEPRSENTHPFRFRSWLFAHHGTLPRFGEIEGALRAQVPEFLSRSIRGQTDSELLFHRVLTALNDAGRLDDVHVTSAHVREAIGAALAGVRDLAGADALATSELTLAMTNGRLLVVLRHGEPLYVHHVQGVVDCPLCREKQPAHSRAARAINHDQLRAVALVGGAPVTTNDPAARMLPNRTFLSVSEAIVPEETPLKI